MTMTKLFALIKRAHEEEKNGVDFVVKYGKAFADFIDDAMRAFEALCVCGISAKYLRTEARTAHYSDLKTTASHNYKQYAPQWAKFAVNNGFPVNPKSAAHSFKLTTGYFPSDFRIWKYTDIDLAYLGYTR